MHSESLRRMASPVRKGDEGMEQGKILNAHVQVRRMYNLLTEIQDLTTQIAHSLDRNDQVSTQMLIAMREEPLYKMAQAREIVIQQLESLSQEDSVRLRTILNGGEAHTPEEKRLAEQVAMNGRLMQQVQMLDRQVNQKLTRDKSIYN